MDYYDLILTGMFCSLLVGAFIGVATSIPINFGVAAGATLSIGLMYHGMFERAPVKVSA